MKWRKIKKRLKRDVLPKMVGMYIGLDAVGGCPMKIVGIKIYPSGGKSVRYSYSVEPMDKELYEKSIMEYEQKCERSDSYSLSFDMPRLKKKDLMTLMGW